jgi:DNA-binding response OmpR family regulator
VAERILLVEDEEKLARMVELELQYEGYQVDKAFDGPSGLEKALSGKFQLVLLDVMLPGMSGMEVLRRLRKESQVPVIMLTARDAVMDKVSGLDLGANDYITKPFAIEELLARIRAAFRVTARSPETEETETLRVGPLTLEPDSRQVTVKGERVELTRKEFDLLEYLLRNKGKVVTRDALLDHVWGFDFVGETNAVDVYIRFLRTKLDEKFDLKLIRTVRGVGYVIEETEG